MNKKFLGSGDPFAHVSNFVQVVEAENVTDYRMQYQGFGMTLERDATDWFQSLKNISFADMEAFYEDFTGEFSKRGIEHNTYSKIYDFQQEKRESVRTHLGE